MTTEVVKHGANGAIIQRQEFGSTTMEKASNDTAQAGITAREQALIQARFIMAERHNRRWEDVRVRMLAHCDRPRFAEKARYKKPQGKKQVNGEWIPNFVEGFSARFAETLAQEMGNVDQTAPATFEDERIRIVRACVLDMERNIGWSKEVTTAKVVEKKGKKQRGSSDKFDPPEGREVISVRLNSYGEPVFLCIATDEELLNKEASAISKIHRNFILKLCPIDILEDCEDRCYASLEKETTDDPLAARRRWTDSFARIGIVPSELEAYLGKPQAQWSNKDVEDLRSLGTAIKEGETTFQEAMRQRFDTVDEEGNQQGSKEAQDRVAAEKLAAIKAESDKQQKAKASESDAASRIPADPDENDANENYVPLGKSAEEQPRRTDKPTFGGPRK